MRIAMISYHTCPLASIEGKETGGMNIYVLELSRALAKKGHTVDVYTRSHETDDALIMRPAPNFRVMHLPAGPQSPLSKRYIRRYIPAFAKEYEAFVKSQKIRYDVIHAHYYQSGSAAQKIMKGQRTAFVMSFHTLALMKNLVARDTRERESQLRIDAEFRLMRAADTVIASSESDKQYLQYLYDVPDGKINIILPGIDPSLFHPMNKHVARRHIHADKEHKIVLFVGRVEPLKGIDTILYAMKIIKKRNPKQIVCLWIVGGDVSERANWPKTLQELKRLRKTLGFPASCVHFVGQKPQKELPYYYSAADVVVMPSHYESFGLAALEAMACGTPVITTNVAGISGTIDRTYQSLVTTVNNPLLLASQMQKMLTGSVLTRNFVKEAKKRASELTWDRTADRMLEVYHTLGGLIPENSV